MRRIILFIMLGFPCCCFGQFRKPSTIFSSLDHTFTLPSDYPSLSFYVVADSSSVLPATSPLLRKSEKSMRLDNGTLNQFRSGNTMYNYSSDFKIKTTYEFDNMGNFKGSGFEIGAGGGKKKRKN